MFFINLKSHNMLKVTLSTDLNSLIDLPKERKELLAIVPGGVQQEPLTHLHWLYLQLQGCRSMQVNTTILLLSSKCSFSFN